MAKRRLMRADPLFRARFRRILHTARSLSGLCTTCTTLAKANIEVVQLKKRLGIKALHNLHHLHNLISSHARAKHAQWRRTCAENSCRFLKQVVQVVQVVQHLDNITVLALHNLVSYFLQGGAGCAANGAPSKFAEGGSRR
jgi:hypothetical protein